MEEEQEEQEEQKQEGQAQQQEQDWTGWGTSTAGDCESHRATEERKSSRFRCRLLHTESAQTEDSSLLSVGRNLAASCTNVEGENKAHVWRMSLARTARPAKLLQAEAELIQTTARRAWYLVLQKLTSVTLRVEHTAPGIDVLFSVT